MTEDELDLWGIVPVLNKAIKEPVKKPKCMSEKSVFLRGMATCHSLSVIDGKLGGDPLDIKVSCSIIELGTAQNFYFQMFNSTAWIINDLSTSAGGHIVVNSSEDKVILTCSLVF